MPSRFKTYQLCMMSELLTVSEAARGLEASAQTVRAWADRGKLPVTRTEKGMRLFQRDDVIRFRDERQTLTEAAQ